MDYLTFILFAAGFFLLIGGAEILVRGASKMAKSYGISPLVIGLTVVAFGTSSPELAVSVLAAHSGQSGIALGNVIGSNICNVLLILGLSALVAPLVVARQVIRLEVPIMIGASLLLLLLAGNGQIGRIEGLWLFAGVIIYTVWTVRRSRMEIRRETPVDSGRDPEKGKGGGAFSLIQILGGLALLGIGSNWLVDGSVAVAKHFGVTDLVIGLTVVAVGTSLPELATSLLASFRGERDIAVGNIVGSNIFNILAVLGLTAALAPQGVPVPRSAILFDLPIMLAVAFACLPIFFTGMRISRWEGGLFLCFFLGYTAFVVLSALQHQRLEMFSQVMVWFVLPLTVLTLIVSFWQGLRKTPPET